jgi:hypothetical protein
MEIEGLKVVHALPGRVRLKAAKVKGNPALAPQGGKEDYLGGVAAGAVAGMGPRAAPPGWIESSRVKT